MAYRRLKMQTQKINGLAWRIEAQSRISEHHNTEGDQDNGYN